MQNTCIVLIFHISHDIMLNAYMLLWHISVFISSHSFLQFTKRYLERADISDIDPEIYGPAIAAGIIDCSSLTMECIKSRRKCSGSDPFKMCEGSCDPGRHFHTCCISKTQIVDGIFKCQICDPTKREEYSFKCGGKPDNTILNCKDMCESFYTQSLSTCWNGCLPMCNLYDLG